MTKNVLIVLIVILVVVVGGLLAWYFTKENPINSNNSVSAGNINLNRPPDNTVWIKEGNFTPAVITVKTGEKVTWINKDKSKRIVASDPFPTSTDLPELVSGDLTEGQSYSFTFTKAGEWVYHDNLNPIKKGKIIVQ